MKKNLSGIILLMFLLSMAPSFAETAERLNVYYNNGVTYFKDKKYSSAILEFKKVIRRRPYDKTVQNAIAMAYLARAQYYIDTEKAYKKAINDLRSAITYFKYWDGDVVDDKKATVEKAQNNLDYLTRMYSTANTGEAIFKEAKALRAQGEFAAAIYENMLLYKTQNYGKQAYSANSDIYKTLNNEKMAIDCIRTAINKDKEDGSLHFKYAVILDDIGNDDASMDEYSKALQYAGENTALLDELQNLWMKRSVENPKDSQALINLGAILQKKGELELAKSQYIKARQINPNDPVALINLASVYTELSDYDSAIKTYDEILAKNPSDLSARFYKGKIYEKKEDISSAVKEYRGILALKKDDERAKDALNGILSSLSGDKLAGYLHNEAINNPTDYDAQFKYAFEMHKNKAYLPAIEFYKKCVQLNPLEPEPYINMAQIFIEQKDLEKANNVIAHGLSYIPQNRKLLELQDTVSKTVANDFYSKGSELFNNGSYQEAINYFLKMPQKTPETYIIIGNCYQELNDSTNAIKYYNMVLEKDPQNKTALMMLANQMVALKKNNQAKTYLEHILSIEPNNKDAKDMLQAISEGEIAELLDTAVGLYEKKKYTEALAMLDKLSGLDPKNPYAYYYKGAIYDETNKGNSIEEYKKAIQADPNFSLAYYMIAVAYDTKEAYKEAVNYYEQYIKLKEKEGVSDEYSTYAKSRSKELKEYLAQQ